MLSLIAIAGFGAASPLPGQQPQSPPTSRQGLDLVAMQCGGGTEARTQGTPAGQGAVRGRFGDTMRAGRADRPERPARLLELMGQLTPGMILQHKETLKLNDAQIKGLGALEKQAQTDCAHHMQLAVSAHRAASRLLDATAPDFAVYTAKLREASAHTVEAQLAMAKAAVAARKILNADQQQTIKSRMQTRQQRR